MDIATDIIDILKLDSGRAVQIWHISDKLPKEIKLITQSSAYCFYGDKLAIVKNKQGYWAIPGGHIETGEHPKDTAIREAREEACIKISSVKLIGYQEIVLADKSKIYQLRWTAAVSGILEFKPELEIAEMKFVLSSEVGKYISWWDSSNGGKAELKEAVAKYRLPDND